MKSILGLVWIPVVALTAWAVVLSGSSVLQAATFSLTLPDLGDLTVVEADPFLDGGTAGNTVRADGSGTFWASEDTSNTDGLWRQREYNAFNAGYDLLPGATDRTFEISAADRTGAPELQTSVTGLAAGNYEVFLVHTIRNDGNAGNAGSKAELNGPISGSTTNYGDANVAELLDGATGVWSTAFSSLGTTGGGAIDFTVNVAGSTAFGRNHIVAVAYQVSTTPVFEASIERSTGALSLSNNGGGAGSILGYLFTSEFGTLDQAGWDSIADTGDADSGGSIDPDDIWTKLSDAVSNTDLSESQLVSGGPQDGVSLAGGSSIALGDAWIQSPTEDVALRLLFGDGTVETLAVGFTGNGGEAFEVGDLNFQDGITAADWGIFRDNFQTDLSGLSPPQSYPLGDLNGDGDNDWDDFDQFKTSYNAANGAGSFAAMLRAVPEPGTLVLLSLGGLALLVRRRSFCTQALAVSAAVGMVLCGGTTVRAATFDATIGSTAVTIVEADPFKEGDTPGNTVRADDSGTFWASVDTSNTDGLWREREYSAFNAGYDLLPGATNRTFEVGGADNTNAPALRTTVGGLAPALYEVFELYTTRADNSADDGHTTAILNDAIANGVDYRWEEASDTLPNVSGVWTTSIASLGLTAGDATGFFVEARGSNGGRSHHIGVAYRPISQLTLNVYTATGQIAIANNSGTAIDADGYEIRSVAGSLDVAGWNSLENQDYEGSGAPGDGMGWEEMGVPSANFLSEAILTTSDSFADAESVSLGGAFDKGVEDLAFSFRAPDGTLIPGIVFYDDTPVLTLAGDYNSSGQVEQGDLDLVLLNWGADASPAPDGWNNPDHQPTAPQINQDELDGVLLNWGNTAASAQSVPEPNSGLVMLLAGLTASGFWSARRRKRARNDGGDRMTGLDTSRIRALIAVALGLIVSGAAMAGVTNDREYWFGEDTLEGASQGATIGSNNSGGLPAGNSADSKGGTGAFLDVTQSGGPTYENVGPGGLGRPGAAAGDFGAKFDGTDDYLWGVPLNRPDEMAGPTPVGSGPLVDSYPFNYDTITARGAQMWVYPDAAKVGAARQVVLMDTIAAGGVAITAEGNWTQINDGHTDTSPGGPVVGDQWYHVMHHVYPSGSPGAPLVVSGSDLGFTGVIYVDGIAVSANNDTPNPGDLTAGSRVGKLTVGAEEISGDGVDPEYDGYFQGVVDDLEMYVFGDNTAAGGQDYGTFDLFADNAWIANEIATTVPGGVLSAGDVNKDGAVNGDGTGAPGSDDVSAFVVGWLSKNTLPGAHRSAMVGDWQTWDNGDMNHDGYTELLDAFILHEALLDATGTGLNFDLLTSTVPEPSSLVLFALAVTPFLRIHRRK